MAVVLTGVFCIVNNKVLNISPKVLYDIACEVAKSKPHEKEVIIKALENTFQKIYASLIST